MLDTILVVFIVVCGCAVVWNLFVGGHYLKHLPGNEPYLRWWWCTFCQEDKSHYAFA